MADQQQTVQVPEADLRAWAHKVAETGMWLKPYDQTKLKKKRWIEPPPEVSALSVEDVDRAANDLIEMAIAMGRAADNRG
jgi:hypothetical protein